MINHTCFVMVLTAKWWAIFVSVICEDWRSVWGSVVSTNAPLKVIFGRTSRRKKRWFFWKFDDASPYPEASLTRRYIHFKLKFNYAWQFLGSTLWPIGTAALENAGHIWNFLRVDEFTKIWFFEGVWLELYRCRDRYQSLPEPLPIGSRKKCLPYFIV